MNAEQARSTRFLVWCALLLLALRPVAPVEAAVAWVTAPLRVLGELAAPLRIFERRSLLAAERVLAESAFDEEEQSVRLKRDLQRGAEPSDPALREHRILVAGEVRGRDPASDDRILVRLSDIRGVRAGLPVVAGNNYVGRVLSVDADGVRGEDGTEWGTVVVELVTAAGFHVGASIDAVGEDGRPVYCTVGGLYIASGASSRASLRGLSARDGGAERGRAADLWAARRLCLHNPSDRKLAGGLARVDELFDDAETFAELSRGFVLGEVQRLPEGEWQIIPQLDFEDGLFQVVVLVPEDAGAVQDTAPELASDARWRLTRPLVARGSSPWREAAVINAGSLAGLEEGAAVTAVGQRLVGRVSRVDPLTARVAFVGDPGFQIVAVARIEGLAEPLVMGRLVSMGRDDRTGDVLFAWLSQVEGELPGGEAMVPARLFTGSGDPGLESGYFVGSAMIPRRSSGRRVVRLAGDVAPHLLRRLYVRIDPASFQPRGRGEEGGGHHGPSPAGGRP